MGLNRCNPIPLTGSIPKYFYKRLPQLVIVQAKK